MLGYVIEKPTSIPEAVWALKTSLTDYSWQNSNPPDLIELSLSTTESRTVYYPKKPPISFSGTLLGVTVGNTPIKSESPPGVRIDIFSISARIAGIQYGLREFSPSDLQNPSLILLPTHLEFLSPQELSELEKLFMKYTHSYMKKSAAAQALCGAIFIEIIYLINEYARGKERSIAKDKYLSYYAQKAKSIIDMRFAEHITLSSVASELGITPGYLSTVFKKCLGDNFSQVLFEKRINEVKRLVCESSLSVSEVAERCGLGDDSNLRRRFKSHFGTSIREYRSITKEQTLYHEKPIRK